MAKSVLDIIIKLSKQGGADKETVKGLVSVKSAIMNTAAVAGMLVAAGVAIKKALDVVVDEAANAELANLKLAAVLKSTGEAAGMSYDELDKLATSLSRVSTYDDEAIKSTEALLLTFTKINQDVFPDALQLTLDMSTALGTDLKASAIQLGKALNDPILGVTALRKVGVSFTKDQLEMIKALVESGDMMGAQKLILQELTTEFGGQAQAAASSYTGQVIQLKNEFGNLKEVVGEDLLPELKELTSDLRDVTIFVTDNYETIKKWGNAISWVINPFLKLSLIMGGWLRDLVFTDETIDSSAVSYTAWAKAIEEGTGALDINTTFLEDNAEALKLISDANKGLLDLVGKMQSAEDSYQSNVRSLADERIQIEQDRAEAIAQGWSEGSEKIRDYDAALAENSAKSEENAAKHELDSKKIVLGILEQRLAQDGLTTDEMNFLLEKGVAWGIYSDTVITEARNAMAEVEDMAAAIETIPTEKTFTLTVQQLGGYNIGTQQYQNIAHPGRAGGGPVVPGRMYTVGENGPEQFVSERRGTIIPGAGGGGGVNVSLTIASPVTIMDEQNAKRVLLPYIIDGIRQAQAKGQIR